MFAVRKNGWLLGLALGVTILGLALASWLRTEAMFDFRAFWCGGVVVAKHANPYLQQPLQQCEQMAGPPWEASDVRQVAMPAPLPPYALLGYAMLSGLPFSVASALYELVLIAAISVAIALLARIVRLASFTIAAVLAPITWTHVILLGQPTPLVLLALAGAALCAQRSRPVAASICLMGATIEPHIALPAAIGLFVLWPPTRIPIVAGFVGLAGLSVAAVGPEVTLSYVRDVLPATALANAYESQLSLTSLLTHFGVAAHRAVFAGMVSYVLMTLLGVFVAGRLVHREREIVPAVLIPPAFSVFLGVYVHYPHLAIAFPAALYVMVRSRGTRGLAAAGLGVAMLPWDTLLAPALIGMWTLLVAEFSRVVFGTRRALLIAVSVTSCLVGTSLVAFVWPNLAVHHARFVAHVYPAHAPAEVSWADYSRQEKADSSPLLLWIRVPSIAGVACCLAASVLAAFPSRRRAVADTRAISATADI